MYHTFVYAFFPANLYTVFKVAPLRGKKKSQISLRLYGKKTTTKKTRLDTFQRSYIPQIWLHHLSPTLTLLLKNSSELDVFKENVPSNSHTNTVFGSVFTTRREGFQNRVVENICQRY